MSGVFNQSAANVRCFEPIRGKCHVFSTNQGKRSVFTSNQGKRPLFSTNQRQSQDSSFCAFSRIFGFLFWWRRNDDFLLVRYDIGAVGTRKRKYDISRYQTCILVIHVKRNTKIDSRPIVGVIETS